MKLDRPQIKDDDDTLSGITKSLSIYLSRRGLLKTVFAGAALVGLGTFETQTASAACTTCNHCETSCFCHSEVTCCRPDGSACWLKTCDVTNCTIWGTYAWLNTCNGCAPLHGCGTCLN